MWKLYYRKHALTILAVSTIVMAVYLFSVILVRPVLVEKDSRSPTAIRPGSLLLTRYAPNVLAIDLSAAGELVAVGGVSGQVSVWNTGTGEQIFAGRVAGAVLFLRLSSNCKKLCVATFDCDIYDIDLRGGDLSRQRLPLASDEKLANISLNPDQSKFAVSTCGDTNRLLVVDRNMQLVEAKRSEHCLCVASSFDHNEDIRSVCRQGVVSIWRGRSVESLRTTNIQGPVELASFSRDSVCCIGREPLLIDFVADKSWEARQLAGFQTGGIVDITWLGELGYLIAGYGDLGDCISEVRVFDVPHDREITRFVPHLRGMSKIGVSLNRDVLITAAKNGEIRVWKLASDILAEKMMKQ